MIKHKNSVKHDPENGRYGDCHRACLATILGTDPKDMPHFFGNPEVDGEKLISEYLKQFGLAEATVYYGGGTDLQSLMSDSARLWPGVPLILGGTSRIGCNHSVVIIDGEIYNDPTDNGIVGPLDNGHYGISFIAVLPDFLKGQTGNYRVGSNYVPVAPIKVENEILPDPTED